MVQNMKRKDDVRIVLLDIDGVINHGEMFSRRYSRVHGVSLEVLTRFFDGRFQDCIIGKADLKDELIHVLDEWQWRNSVDELLAYWFYDEVRFDKRMLDTIRQLKRQGVKVCGASNQELRRAEYLTERTDLKHLIDEFFISAHLGVKKPDVQFFQKILHTLAVAPSQVVYWDDDKNSVASAKKLGIQSYLYSDYSSFSHQVGTFFTL